jgi:cysteine desulfurase/selenocysteine lyase
MTRIYLDNAATSFPKPPQVINAINQYFTGIGASPGRGGYRLGLEAGRQLIIARDTIARFFNCKNPANVIFTMNITYALNFILRGVLKEGDHVITTSLEHNSVARPLETLKSSGIIDYTVIKATASGCIEPEHIKRAILPKTRMIIINHSSNVIGKIQPIFEIGKIAEEHGILFALDTAQTAGSIAIDMQKNKVDFLAFTGHKGLYGPPGVGGLCIRDKASSYIKPLILGGTGSKSHLLEQPADFPDKLESGTPNTPGIMGLTEGVNFINQTGLETIRKHEQKLLKRFIEGCLELKDLKLYCISDLSEIANMTPCVSLNIMGIDGGQLSFILDQNFGIMTRSGLHCAPWAHQTIGTFPEGTVRFSFGWFNTIEEVDLALNALREIIYD